MKRRKLDHSKLARNLGSAVYSRIAAKPGYFGALQVAQEVRRRFKAPASGGRARDPRWTAKRLIPIRPDTLPRLQELARKVSEIVGYRVEPLQVAALLVERNLEALDEREVLQGVAAVAQRRS